METTTTQKRSGASSKFRWGLPRLTPTLLALCACTANVPDTADAQSTSATLEDVITILPGDRRFDAPSFEDFEVTYNSRMAQDGTFRMQAIKSGDGRKLSMVDIIAAKTNVIVAQRQIDLKSFRSDFSAQPFFAWGQEFVVGQSSTRGYDWTRVPIGGGEPKRMSGEIQNGGYLNEMFSPTLAALMPMDVGAKFQIPEAYPRQGEFVSSEFDQYEVLRIESLNLPSGVSCECWVIEKTSWGGSIDHVWVSREAPFVFRRIRNVGDGRREFKSEVLDFRTIGQ